MSSLSSSASSTSSLSSSTSTPTTPRSSPLLSSIPFSNSMTCIGDEVYSSNNNHNNNHNHSSKKKDDDHTTKNNNSKTLSNTNQQQQQQKQRSKATSNSGANSKRPYSREDFEFGEVLGEGAYSRVVKSIFKPTGKRYATKVILKQQIISQNKLKTVKMERDVLNMMNHPNIIRLFCTFQDKENLYFALELAPGGELFSYISKYGPFSLEAAIFYTAEIVNGLEYMHSMNIIHRDLKPENLILGKDMHTKITDFGTAKVLTQDEADGIEVSDLLKRSRQTFCGTAEYVSPEVLTNQMPSKATDLWALGCIVYQFLTGNYPFKADSEYLTFKRILSRDFEFPSSFPEVARDLVDNLLRLAPEERLGARAGGYAELKQHPFFNGIDFCKLNEMIPPRIVPHSVRSEQLADISMSNGISKSNTRFATSTRKNVSDASQWRRFLISGEKILYTSSVIKRSRMTAKTRQLILTDKHRLLYVDPSTMKLKGQVPWSKDIRVDKKSDRHFYISTPKRVYVLEDVSGKADEWEKAIGQAVSKS